MQMRELTNQEFNEFTNNYIDKSIYQTVEYAKTMNKEKCDSIYVGLIDKDEIIAASLILIEKIGNFKYGYAPRGFLIDYLNENLLREFTKELKKFLGKRNVVAVKLCPKISRDIYDFKYNIITHNEYYDKIFNTLKNNGYYHFGYNEAFEALKPRYEAILDISIPYYMLFRNFPKQLRTKIRSAEDKGIKIYKGTLDELKYLYFQTKKKYPRDLKYYENLYNELNENNKAEFFYAKLDTKYYLKLCQEKFIKQEELCNNLNNLLLNNTVNIKKTLNNKIIEDKKLSEYKNELIYATNLLKNNPDGIVLASTLIGIHDKDIYLLMDGYNTKYKRFNAKHLLLWKLCERYSKKGYKSFNLGGVAGIKSRNNTYTGLLHFKLAFNAKIYEYLGDLEIITNSTLYFMFKNTKPIRDILKR